MTDFSFGSRTTSEISLTPSKVQHLNVKLQGSSAVVIPVVETSMKALHNKKSFDSECLKTSKLNTLDLGSKRHVLDALLLRASWRTNKQTTVESSANTNLVSVVKELEKVATREKNSQVLNVDEILTPMDDVADKNLDMLQTISERSLGSQTHVLQRLNSQTKTISQGGQITTTLHNSSYINKNIITNKETDIPSLNIRQKSTQQIAPFLNAHSQAELKIKQLSKLIKATPGIKNIKELHYKNGKITATGEIRVCPHLFPRGKFIGNLQNVFSKPWPKAFIAIEGNKLTISKPSIGVLNLTSDIKDTKPVSQASFFLYGTKAEYEHYPTNKSAVNPVKYLSTSDQNKTLAKTEIIRITLETKNFIHFNLSGPQFFTDDFQGIMKQVKRLSCRFQPLIACEAHAWLVILQVCIDLEDACLKYSKTANIENDGTNADINFDTLIHSHPFEQVNRGVSEDDIVLDTLSRNVLRKKTDDFLLSSPGLNDLPIFDTQAFLSEVLAFILKNHFTLLHGMPESPLQNTKNNQEPDNNKNETNFTNTGSITHSFKFNGESCMYRQHCVNDFVQLHHIWVRFFFYLTEVVNLIFLADSNNFVIIFSYMLLTSVEAAPIDNTKAVGALSILY